MFPFKEAAMEKKVDLRIEKTYRALYAAFTALLEEKRFEDFTLNELCERAMIRRTTFYKHFADKYEYFLFYVKETCASMQNQFPPEALNEGFPAYFIYMCRALIRFLDRNEKMVNNIISSSMFPVLLDGLAEQIMNDTLVALRSSSEFAHLTTAQLENLAAFYSGGIVNTVRLALRRGKKLDEEAFATSMSKFLR